MNETFLQLTQETMSTEEFVEIIQDQHKQIEELEAQIRTLREELKEYESSSVSMRETVLKVKEEFERSRMYLASSEQQNKDLRRTIDHLEDILVKEKSLS